MASQTMPLTNTNVSCFNTRHSSHSTSVWISTTQSVLTQYYWVWVTTSHIIHQKTWCVKWRDTHNSIQQSNPITALNCERNVPMINDIEVWQKEFVLFYWTINRKMEFHSSNARRDFEASTLFVYCTNNLFFSQLACTVYSAHCKFTQIFYII